MTLIFGAPILKHSGETRVENKPENVNSYKIFLEDMTHGRQSFTVNSEFYLGDDPFQSQGKTPNSLKRGSP